VITFAFTVGLSHWQIIFGLIIGSVTIAPFAAYVCKKLPSKTLIVLVGGLVIVLSLRTLILMVT